MSRRVEIERAVDAPVDAVWRALTEAAQLEQWFPVEARVTPGPNGTIWLSWGEGAEGTGRITHWEPTVRFGWEDTTAGQRLATDFFLERRGARTVVRVVTSGFSDDPQWDDEFHMLEGGWAYFMAHLQTFLERHHGGRRQVSVNRRQTELPKAAAYARLVGALGFGVAPGQTGSFRVTTGAGDELAGRIIALNPGVQLGLEIENLNYAMLFVEMEGPKHRAKPAMWLSTYGLPGPEAHALGARMGELYERALTSE